MIIILFLFVTLVSILPAALCTVICNVQRASLVKFLRDLIGVTSACGAQIADILQCAFWNCVGGGLSKREVFLMYSRGSLRWTHFLIYVTRFSCRDDQFTISITVLLFSGVIRVCVVDYKAKNSNKDKHTSLQFTFSSFFPFLFPLPFYVFFDCL